jgi:glycine oxidase
VNRHADVIVIGAGIVGCAIACELARRGTAVRIVDDRPAGMGATQASAGVLAPYLEAREGTAFLDLTVRSLNLYDSFIAELAGESGEQISYRRTGTIDIALDDDALRTLQERATVLTRIGVSSALLSPDAVRSEEPHVGYGAAGALLVEAHGFVVVADLIRALTLAGRQHGIEFAAPARAHRISRQDDAVAVDTDNGTLSAATVVLAAGSWSGAIDVEGAGAHAPVRPVRGQLLSLAWRGTPLRRTTWGSRCYLVPWDDGTLLVGATMEEAGFDERATVAGVRDLLEAAGELIPHAWSAGFNGAKVGLRPATTDGLPIVGRSAAVPNLVYATGHFRNGVLLAPLTAKLVADLVMGSPADSALAALAPSRFGAL